MDQPKLKLISRHHEYGDVETFVFERGWFEFAAGQYAWVHLEGPEPEYLQRELSFASAPSDRELWLTVHLREASNYKRRLAALESGQYVRIRDVRGLMVLPETGVESAIMVGQGIGATPFRAILRQAGHDVRTLESVVLHVARDNYVFAEEFTRLASQYERIGRNDLQSRIEHWRSERPGAAWLVAGSPEFVAGMARRLGLLGVSYREIRSTMFEAYADGEE